MKTKTVAINVSQDKIGMLADPTNSNHQTYHALVRIGDLPLDMSLSINPRFQNIHSRVAKEIANGLNEEPETFYLRNRGLTIVAQGAKYDAKKKQLVLEINSDHGGVLDGGTSYAVIRSEIENAIVEEEKAKKELESNPEQKDAKENFQPPSFLDGYVKLECIVGIKDDLVVEVAQSRNTSIQVKEQSLINLSGSFNFLKEIFNKEPFGDQIAYRENEDKPIDIREIISLMTLFHSDYALSEKPPMIGYTSRNKCLDLFQQDENKFKLLTPIVVDICRLYDHVASRFPGMYQEIGGIMGSGEEDKRKTKGTRLSKVIGVRRYRSGEGYKLSFTGQSVEYKFPDGYLYPVVASLRGLVMYNGQAKFKVNPFTFFDDIGKSLLRMTLDTSKSVGKRPNAIGKARNHWVQLHDRVITAYLMSIEQRKAA